MAERNAFRNKVITEADKRIEEVSHTIRMVVKGIFLVPRVSLPAPKSENLLAREERDPGNEVVIIYETNIEYRVSNL